MFVYSCICDARDDYAGVCVCAYALVWFMRSHSVCTGVCGVCVPRCVCVYGQCDVCVPRCVCVCVLHSISVCVTKFIASSVSEKDIAMNF